MRKVQLGLKTYILLGGSGLAALTGLVFGLLALILFLVSP